MDFSQCQCSSCTRLREWAETGRAQAERPPSGWPKMEPEPAPEPVYTHVLLDFNGDEPQADIVELHTAESLLKAIESRHEQDGRYKVYKLGALILDVVEVE